MVIAMQLTKKMVLNGYIVFFGCPSSKICYFDRENGRVESGCRMAGRSSFDNDRIIGKEPDLWIVIAS